MLFVILVLVNFTRPACMAYLQAYVIIRAYI